MMNKPVTISDLPVVSDLHSYEFQDLEPPEK